MIQSARPAPGTTELLEVLDRVLGGGIVVDDVPRAHVVGLASAGIEARLVVARMDAYLHDPNPEYATALRGLVMDAPSSRAYQHERL